VLLMLGLVHLTNVFNKIRRRGSLDAMPAPPVQLHAYTQPFPPR
jgi:hypothetical protein